MRNIEQALWYINMAALVVLFARLYAQGLVGTYPLLFAYPFVDTLEQIVTSAFAQHRNIYTEIYFVGQTAVYCFLLVGAAPGRFGICPSV